MRDAAAAQPNNGQSAQIFAVGHGEGNDIGPDWAHSTDHDAFPHATELMDSSETAEKCAVTNRDMTAERYVVRKRHLIADPAIVRDVASDHEKAALAHAGHPAAVFRTGIHCRAFADITVRPDNQARGAAAIMHRLRWRPERSERVDDRAFTDRCDAGDMNVSDQAHTIAKLNIGPDCAVGTDL